MVATQVFNLQSVYQSCGRYYEGYTLYLRRIGASFHSMFNHPLDGINPLHNTHGIEYWSEWARVFFDVLVAMLDTNQLPPPSYLVVDSLDSPKLMDFDWVGQEASPCQYLAEVFDFSQAAGLVEDLLAPGFPISHAHNKHFRSAIKQMTMLVTDGCMQQSIYKQARKHIENIKCMCVGVEQGMWHRALADEVFNVRTIQADMSCPLLDVLSPECIGTGSMAPWAEQLRVPLTGRSDLDIENLSASLMAMILLRLDTNTVLPVVGCPYTKSKYAKLYGDSYGTITVSEVEHTERYFKRTIGTIRDAGCSDALLSTPIAQDKWWSNAGRYWMLLSKAIGL